MPSQFSNYFLFLQGQSSHPDAIDFTHGYIRAILVRGLVFDPDNHKYIPSVMHAEVVGPGYARGGFPVDTEVIQDNDNDLAVIDAPDVVLPNTTIESDGLVLYKNTGNLINSPIICHLEFGRVISSTNGDFTVEWNHAGIFRYRKAD